MVPCDSEKIQQVLFNLLHNAMKFTRQGVITITVATKRTSHDLESDNDSVIISIKDQGTGVDPSIKDKLFEKFETKSANGAGLGLYLSRKIVEAHGGKIWVEGKTDSSYEEERGAIFAFSIPLKNQSKQQ
ncbi:MAG TPA: HAMP domain-containing sensor histidine kinase [Nitrososphaeraceae archaeon]|nr:HAMP domain-containing sensor histidine kinase [Nitrososphaeraceae archaeon]